MTEQPNMIRGFSCPAPTYLAPSNTGRSRLISCFKCASCFAYAAGEGLSPPHGQSPSRPRPLYHLLVPTRSGPPFWATKLPMCFPGPR